MTMNRTITTFAPQGVPVTFSEGTPGLPDEVARLEVKSIRVTLTPDEDQVASN